MIISLIAAMTINHVIGIKNTIPWYSPIDMEWFKYHTLNKPIIMGRKTFESIGKKPLKNRLNIVLSRFLSNDCESNVYIVKDVNQALSLVNDFYEVMIIGGGEVYKKFFSKSQRLYLTYVNTVIRIQGDTLFPFYNINEWKCIFNKFCNVKEKNNYYSLNFIIFERL